MLVCQDYEGPQFEKAVAVGKMARLPVYAIFQGGVNDWNRIGRTVQATSWIIDGKMNRHA